ncbi:amylo-alpha-1,6-glucosidase [Massilia sp. R2A-15]|uniref:amylo-alpha-1,6-glucosidase n=1 Tax=Massilia sp. R2A-15 TaxID=3064278 RepID=UPI0027352E17|nr:amylo-alpha-1,6-glucosidase [Massilia sp. R2A-15]WLI88181.1 amylo-alpha-1,6-glucosidase [Massilia sp. R2A-15]
MKRTLLALAASLALHPAMAQVPGVDAFFDAMAITVAPGHQSQFVAGDNLDGYFAGMTQSLGKGEGYVTRAGTLLLDYSSIVDGVANDRAGSREQVLPYGRRVRFPNGATEEMALLSKRHALAMAVTSPRAATLAIAPMLVKAGALRQDGDVVSGPVGSMFVAFAADQPFILGEGLVLRSVQPARSFTVVAAFGASEAEAAQRARQLAASDPIRAEKAARHAALTRSYLATSDAEYNKALNWAKASASMFVVEEFGTGIWAGLPWFRDNWGRDTFIALPGTLLVSGQFDQAKAVLANFARFQNLNRDKEYGRIPNRVSATEKTIYNTVDGTPWMLREALEYIRYTGDKECAAQMYKLAVPYFEGAIANYTDAQGLLSHDSADTWMDARIENRQPWSARGPRAVEIQALWYTALKTGAELAAQAGDATKAREWSALAEKVQRSFLSAFWDGAVMADRLREDGSRDTKVRPNQLMLVSIPFDDFVPPAVQARVTRNAVSELLYPYGIASLSQIDPYFHPRHENPAFHHKDAAYHQGTIWGWNAGFTVTALDKFGYQDLAWPLTQNLGRQILGLGTLGTMSELLDAMPDANGKLKPSGTYAQSWSVAEYARNGYQDYVGFRPDLPANTLAFTPAIPAAWTSFYALLPFGAGEAVEVDFKRQRWTFRLKGATPRTVRFSFLNADKSRSQVSFTLTPAHPATLTLGNRKASLDGRALQVQSAQASYAGVIGKLGFRTPAQYVPAHFPMLRSKDALKGVVERGEYR